LANGTCDDHYLVCDQYRHWLYLSKAGLIMGKAILDIAMWIILGSLAVLAVMNAKNFATDVTAVGGVVTGESTILSGSGYKLAR